MPHDARGAKLSWMILPPESRARLAGVAVLATAALVAAGCGSSDSSSSDTTSAKARTVDTSAVESGIKKELSSSSNEVTDVKCPTDEKVQAGATFDCTVTWADGATGKVKVTQNGGNNYTYALVSGSVQIPGATLDKTIEQQLAKQGAPNATVTCPQNVIVKTGTTVTCNVSGASGAANGTVTFTFSSSTGTVDSSSVKTS